ncbi:hypothetical protein E5CHR_02625 [Variovorax sp. PBL-E5]|nr:hypothetical protein E5CHR_02625 [Variovorax sp. PBL-E5]
MNSELVPVDFEGYVHQRPEGTARWNFNEHRVRFVIGADFHEIDQPDEIRSLGIARPKGGTPSKVLFTIRRSMSGSEMTRVSCNRPSASGMG